MEGIDGRGKKKTRNVKGERVLERHDNADEKEKEGIEGEKREWNREKWTKGKRERVRRRNKRGGRRKRKAREGKVGDGMLKEGREKEMVSTSERGDEENFVHTYTHVCT